MNSLHLEAFNSLVAAGIQAPSADNRHRVLFECARGAIRLRSTVDLLSLPGHRQVLSYLSHGAVVENMSLHARKIGRKLAVNWFPDNSDPLLVAELTVDSEDAGPDDLAVWIPKRHTNRKFFRGPPLTIEDRCKLDAEVQRFQGIELLWLDTRERRGLALGMVRRAEAERFRHRYFHRELFDSIRFGLGWAVPSDEGLAPGSLEVERPLRPLFSALRFWPLARVLNAFGMHHILGFRAGYVPCRLSPHLCTLVTSLELREGALIAGRAFERLWLRATSLGISLQPMAASALFALPVCDRVSSKMRQRLAAGWERLAPGRRPLMVFRLGRADLPTIINGRRSMATYIGRGPTS